MIVSIIAAIGRNREIGKNNDLLWHLSKDMRFFKETTVGHYVIMGRKNFESIPPKYRPLPHRINIILSRNEDFMAEECYTYNNIEEAIEMARDNGEEQIFIIGGAQIYKLAMEADLVSHMYLTYVDASFPDADAFFPEFDESEWIKTTIESQNSDFENEYSFEIFQFLKPQVKEELEQKMKEENNEEEEEIKEAEEKPETQNSEE
jgi:dihydrofolate reductase